MKEVGVLFVALDGFAELRIGRRRGPSARHRYRPARWRTLRKT